MPGWVCASAQRLLNKKKRRGEEEEETKQKEEIDDFFARGILDTACRSKSFLKRAGHRTCLNIFSE